MLKSSCVLASAVTTLALAAPAAHAMPAIDRPANTAPRPVVFVDPAASSADEFDWDSAAVGAGGVAGLVALAGLGIAIVGRTRTPATR